MKVIGPTLYWCWIEENMLTWKNIPLLESFVCLIITTLVARMILDAICPASVSGCELNSSLSSWRRAQPRSHRGQAQRKKVVHQTELGVCAHFGTSSADPFDINTHVWTPKTRTLGFKKKKKKTQSWKGTLAEGGPAVALLQITRSKTRAAGRAVQGILRPQVKEIHPDAKSRVTRVPPCRAELRCSSRFDWLRQKKRMI